MTNWHMLDASAVLTELQSSAERGLTSTQVAERMAQNGPNELVEKRRRTTRRIFWEQITATLVLILVAAVLIAGLLGDFKSMVTISVVVLFYASLGFLQEYHAEQAITTLKKMKLPNVRVIRDGRRVELLARELVPGDIIQLEAGGLLPADVRLLEAVNLRIQEAALTGESEPVEKQTAALSGSDLPLGDRLNMGYMSTVVTQGRGLALVVATGMQTELGQTADLIQQNGVDQTPLQKRLDILGRQLAVMGAVSATLIAILGILRGEELRHMLFTAVNIAVAIVPEGLPAVVILTLVLGAQRLLKRQVFIRKLPAVETLGSVTVICSDKTGTLTENRMTVVALDVADHELDLTQEMDIAGDVKFIRATVPSAHLLGETAEETGEFRLKRKSDAAISLTAIGGALCNDAKLIDIGDGRYHTLGDPTEGALVVAAARMGYWKSSLDSFFPRIAELAFDSERKRMTTVHSLEQYDPAVLVGLEVGRHRYIAFTKGRVDGLLGLTSHVWADGKARPLDAGLRSRIEAANGRLARKGMRVLGVAFRLLDAIPDIIQTDLEQQLTFVGLFGMIDPPRGEVREAVAACHTAGIRPVMITGDHPLTAIEIARQLGITENSRVLTGAELENLSFAELKNVADEVSVFARVAPEHKLRIVQALQERGHIVSMTGDGMNDAPALRRADIGVAMGITGTEVSKEAADLVLLDDNFATIVGAVQEGRGIHDNLRQFVRFSIAGNIGKILVMLLAPFVGKAFPLLPLQLLWLNLLTDGLLGVGLGMEKAGRDTMKRRPYLPKESVFSRGTGLWQTIGMGVLIGALALLLGSWYFFTGRAQWQTMIFTSLAFIQVFHALASHSTKDSLFKTGLLSNPLLAGMGLLVVILQLLVMYIPALAHFFEVVPLSGYDLSITAAIGVMVFIVMEMGKRVRRE